jgi:hypothetical protein
VTILRLTWEGKTAKSGQLDPSPEPHFSDIHTGAMVSLAIAHPPVSSPEHTHHPHITINLDAIAPNLNEHLPSILLPFQYAQTVNDPSLLHLLQLLQTELKSPQLMNQLFVSSIITILTTHLLQNFQLEQAKL